MSESVVGVFVCPFKGFSHGLPLKRRIISHSLLLKADCHGNFSTQIIAKSYVPVLRVLSIQTKSEDYSFDSSILLEYPRNHCFKKRAIFVDLNSQKSYLCGQFSDALFGK